MSWPPPRVMTLNARRQWPRAWSPQIRLYVYRRLVEYVHTHPLCISPAHTPMARLGKLKCGRDHNNGCGLSKMGMAFGKNFTTQNSMFRFLFHSYVMYLLLSVKSTMIFSFTQLACNSKSLASRKCNHGCNRNHMALYIHKCWMLIAQINTCSCL